VPQLQGGDDLVRLGGRLRPMVEHGLLCSGQLVRQL